MWDACVGVCVGLAGMQQEQERCTYMRSSDTCP